VTERPKRASRSTDAGLRPVRSGAAGRRLTRTIVLGAIVVFLAVYWLSDQMGLDRGELLGYALTSLLLVGLLVVLALAGVVVLRLIKRWLR
jgi:uncharacterized membrane protein